MSVFLDDIIIFIDGDCIVCNNFAFFCLSYESNDKFLFSSLNSEFAKYFFKIHKYKPPENTIILLKKNTFYSKSDAIIEISKSLKFPWNLFCLTKIFPKFIRNYGYDLFSRNRYFFGKQESCSILRNKLKSRLKTKAD